MARIPGSHPGFPGSVPGQGMKILLHTTAHCCLAKIKTGRMISLAHGDCSGQDRTERPKSGLFHHQWGLCRGSKWLFRNGVLWCQPVGDMAGPKQATGVSVGPGCVFLVEERANWTFL